MYGALPLFAGTGTFREGAECVPAIGGVQRPQDRLGITSLGESEVTRGSGAAGCRGRRGRGLCLLLRGLATGRVGLRRGAGACGIGTAAAVGQRSLLI